MDARGVPKGLAKEDRREEAIDMIMMTEATNRKGTHPQEASQTPGTI